MPNRPLRSLVPAVLALSAFGAAQSPDPDVAARRIDALVAEGLAAHDAAPNRKADDATFARRAYLTIVGRMPTVAELDRFLGRRGGDARDRLVDELLESPGRVSHEFNQWADVLRIQSRLMRQISGEPYAHFVKDALARNVPYDEMVRQMLTAEGEAHARGNGATGWYLRDLGMPLDNMSNAMRVFLGTRMECAQCHDHPFESWTQRQFFELSAFTAGVRYSTVDPRAPEQREMLAAARELRSEFGDAGQRALRQLVQRTASGIAGSGAGAIELPKDYRYDDARPGEVVVAHVPFGTQPALPEIRVPSRPDGRRPGRRGPARQRGLELPDVGSRAAFAEWVTSPTNPRFTTVIVDRIWKRTFGVGLIEPVDDLRDDSVASNPALLAFLEQLMRDLRYDLRAFQRVLLHTETFGRAASAWDPTGDEPFLFPGPWLRRMSAEQLWDSLLVLATGDPDASLGAPGARAEPVYARYEELAGLDADGLRAFVERESLRTRDPAAYRRMLLAERARDREERAALTREQRQRQQELLRELAVARRKGDQQRAVELLATLRQLRDANAGDRRSGDLVRASEMTQPARSGHFLREWGQSDREQIETSNTDANVPQALQLMNGVVDATLLARGSALMSTLQEQQTVPEKIAAAFRAVLGREPTGAERSIWKRDFARDGDALVDLVWTLVNSHEFRFVQ